MSITGLTIDYGPFGFMEAFDPLYICNGSDNEGRYRYEVSTQRNRMVRLFGARTMNSVSHVSFFTCAPVCVCRLSPRSAGGI